MLRLILPLFVLAIFTACDKPLTCTGYDASGSVILEVEGEDNCESQIDSSAGEYCQCSEAFDS